MIVNCKICNSKNKVLEVLELKDIKNFYQRYLVISRCRKCFVNIAVLYEVRKSDNKIFTDRYAGIEADKIIKREHGRLKKKKVFSDKYFTGWVYGRNIEIKNKQGNVTKVRQYACDFLTGKKKQQNEYSNI